MSHFDVSAEVAEMNGYQQETRETRKSGSLKVVLYGYWRTSRVFFFALSLSSLVYIRVPLRCVVC